MHAKCACGDNFLQCTRAIGEAYFTSRATAKVYEKFSNITVRFRVESRRRLFDSAFEIFEQVCRITAVPMALNCTIGPALLCPATIYPNINDLCCACAEDALRSKAENNIWSVSETFLACTTPFDSPNPVRQRRRNGKKSLSNLS